MKPRHLVMILLASFVAALAFYFAATSPEPTSLVPENRNKNVPDESPMEGLERRFSEEAGRDDGITLGLQYGSRSSTPPTRLELREIRQRSFSEYKARRPDANESAYNREFDRAFRDSFQYYLREQVLPAF